MLCFRHDNAPKGFACVSTEELIYCCTRQIKSIEAYRSQHRRQFVEEYLQNANWWWQNLWKFFLLRKPTRRNALLDYYHRHHPPYFDAICTFGQQEENCRKLLLAAQVHTKPKIYVSEKGLAACNFGK
jgi:hypothetical protein